jgi:hypothetical protein
MQNLNIQTVPSNFIETPVFADEYIFGSNSKVVGTVLKDDGDWRNVTPKFEDQFKYGVESMSCTVYGTLNAEEMLLKEKFDISVDLSERFISTLAGTTKSGNSPHKVAETRRSRGAIEETKLPFSMEITRWEEYYAPISDSLKKEGKKWLKQWDFQHDWVITRDTRKEEKNELLADALKFSPVGVSVFGWADDQGVYVKAGNDNHWCVLVYGDKNYWYVLDSYAPYIKKLNKNYDFGFAKRYSIDRVARRRSCISNFIERIRQ